MYMYKCYNTSSHIIIYG